MRTAILLILATVLACAAEPTERSILFIGNSLTLRNDLPRMFGDLARAGGQGTLAIDRELVGGATLRKHWEDGKALAKLRSRTWTWVVVQEQSTGTVRKGDEFADYARRFIDAAKAQGATPVLYATWARLGEMDTQDGITAAYRDLARETGALLVPAGSAFATYRAAHGDGSLFVDNRHPTPAGTYLAACCFYRILFQASPAGLTGAAAQLDAAQAGEMHTLADAAR